MNQHFQCAEYMLLHLFSEHSNEVDIINRLIFTNKNTKARERFRVS